MTLSRWQARKRAKCDNGDAKSVMMVVIPLFSSEISARMKVPRGTSKVRGALLRVRFSGSMGLRTEDGSRAENAAPQWQTANLVAPLLRRFAFVSFGSRLLSFLCLCGLTHRRLM